MSPTVATHFELHIPAEAPGTEGTLYLNDGVFSGVPQGELGEEDGPVLLHCPQEHATLGCYLLFRLCHAQPNHIPPLSVLELQGETSGHEPRLG